MRLRRDSYIQHSFDNHYPIPSELAVGKLAIVFYDEKNPILYTKDYEGKILEIGKGATRLEDLLDIDITNAKEGNFFIKQGDKFVSSNFLGSIGNLVDVEINNPRNNEYLRYDSLVEAYVNSYPSYYLHELVDVDVADPEDDAASYAQSNHVLYYDHATRTYKTRPRLNLINELADVEINAINDRYQILALDITDGIWKNSDLKIEYDPEPKLGANLDAKGYQIRNSSYRANVRECNSSIVDINYSEGDYWVLSGVPKEVVNQCVVNINISTKANSTSVMMLEIRQDTGVIELGNLPNVKYEDGKPFKLSGPGNTDLLTITQVSTQININSPVITTTYITVTALNLAPSGEGGVASYRYDKNRYPFVQIFELPSRYDTYYDYVESLLTFETEVSTGKTWLEDKACRVSITGDVIDTVVTTTGTQLTSGKVNLGIEDNIVLLNKGISTEVLPVNSVLTSNQYIKVTTAVPILLTGDFTLEMYINYTSLQYRENTTDIKDTHYLFSNQSNTSALAIEYIPFFTSNTQGTVLRIKIGNSTVISSTLHNAYNYFDNKAEDFYTHVCIQRRAGDIELYIDGIRQYLVSQLTFTGVISISEYMVVMNGQMSTLRITNGVCRYLNNMINTPALRFGLVGGANDILDRQIFDSYCWLERDLEHEIFCS